MTSMRDTVRDELAAHRAVSFPSRVQDDLLGDWVGELAEVDAYYAGLASSMAAGERPTVLWDDITRLTSEFEAIRVKVIDEEQALSTAEAFLKSLVRLVDVMRKAAEQHF